MFQKSDIQDMYSLSPMQEGMLFHAAMAPQARAYFEEVEFHISGEFSPEWFRQAFQLLAERYDILRTAFVYKQTAKPRQVLLKKRRVEFHNEDISQLDAAGRERLLEEYRQSNRRRGFDLTTDSLIRCAVFKAGSDDFQALLSFHHIIMDGWCTSILMQDLLAFYQGLRDGVPTRLPYTAPYRTFIQWLEKRDGEEGVEFWQRYLEGFDSQTGIPALTNVQPGGDERQVYRSELGVETTAALGRIAAACKVTVGTVFQTLWGVLLQKYNDCPDAVFGTVVSGRPAELPGVETMVGLFINSVPLRVVTQPGQTFAALVRRVQEEVLQSRKYEYVSLARIQSTSELRGNVFNHLLIYENFPFEMGTERIGDPGKLGFFIHRMQVKEQTHYDLEAMVIPGRSLQLKIQYNPRVYQGEVIAGIGRHLGEMVRQLDEDVQTPVADLQLLSMEETTMMLRGFNEPVQAPAPERTVQQMFARQVARFPHRPALVCGDTVLTYRETEFRAGRVAERLRARGVDRGSVVGIVLERSVEMVIAVLGVWKCGAAYVPIDPGCPEIRRRYILEDCDARVVLTVDRPDLADEADVIDLADTAMFQAGGDVAPAAADAAPGSRAVPCVPGDGRDLAYIIYTSGSTGKPKGVMVEQRGLVNLLDDLEQRYPLGGDAAFLLKTSYTFDISLSELCGWFWGGGRLVILPPGAEREPEVIIGCVERYGVTHINFVPSMCRAFLEYVDDESRERLRSLRFVFLGGEALTAELVMRLRDLRLPLEVENLYGPTEATVYATGYSLSEWREGRCMSIGKPLANMRAFIFQGGQPAPVGVAGELLIGGVGLARGYLNRPELTAEKFIRHPYLHGEMLYRSGDLARWLPDGNIEFLGRLDHQVKIRGHRIELSEIESALAGHEAIRQVVVLAREDHEKNKYLCAYIVADPVPDAAELRNHLQTCLPDYMIPRIFIPLPELRRTTSGKIDRRALPDPEERSLPMAEAAAPRSEMEALLVELWCEVLGRERIGIHDDFFALGGDSIKAIQLAARLYKVDLGVEISHIMLHPTIAALAPFVKPRLQPAGLEAESGEVPLTPIQHWFFEHIRNDRHHWNQALILHRPQGFRRQSLHAACEHLVRHHDAMRMVFREGENGWRAFQRDMDGPLFALTEHDRMGDDEAEFRRTCEAIQAGMDLRQGPLVRLALLHTARGDYLLFAVHHLVVDGVSWRILLEDFAAAYRGAEIGEIPALPPRTTSYRRWAEALQEYAASWDATEEVAYWREVESAIVAEEHPPVCREKQLQRAEAVWNQDETRALLQEANNAYNTESFDLLLGGLGLALREWGRAADWVVALEGHGRETVADGVDVCRTVGWFTSIFPVRLRVPTDDVGVHVKRTKEMLRRIPRKGIGYGILRYLKRDAVRGLGFQQPAVAFNYLGGFSDSVNGGEFTMVARDPGRCFGPEAERHTALDIVAVVIADRLHVTADFDPRRHSREQVEALLRIFLRRLQEIVRHCTGRRESELTASDCSSSTIDDQQAEQVFGLLQELTIP